MHETGYAHPHALVETDWVADHKDDATVRLVEVDVDLQRHPVRDIPNQTEWTALLSRSGIGNDDLVVLHGDNNNWFAAFAYWLFQLYGHQDVALMNGGRVKWLAEGRDLTTEVPVVIPTSYIAPPANVALRAFRDEVAAEIGRFAIALVDVRSPQEYAGELLAPENLPQEGAQRGGHIPGALNIPWATAVAENGTFKPANALRAIYGDQGITPNRPSIAYCRIGERSAHTWFVLRELLGYPDVRNYDGSWTEWGSVIGAPIER